MTIDSPNELGNNRIHGAPVDRMAAMSVFLRRSAPFNRGEHCFPPLYYVVSI